MPNPVRIPSSLLATALLLSCGCAAFPATRDADDAKARAYIIDCSQDWAASVVTGDRSKRRVYFADDFVGTDTKGRRYDKATVTRERGPAKSMRNDCPTETRNQRNAAGASLRRRRASSCSSRAS